MKLLSGGNDPKSQGFIPSSDWDVICHMISIFHIYKRRVGCQALEKGERKKGAYAEMDLAFEREKRDRINTLKRGFSFTPVEF